jgi:hypothetical protein
MVKYGLKSRYYQNSLTSKGIIDQVTKSEVVETSDTEGDNANESAYCTSCAL